MRAILALMAVTWAGLWLTPDQRGQWLFRKGEYVEAARTFRDPMWQGVAWYRAGEFERAAETFARRGTAEALFNQGNAWLMLGKYDQAISCYDRALEKRPDWTEALENRLLAAARAKLVQQQGGEMGDQKIGADEVVFDKHTKPGGQEMEVAGSQAMSDAAIQAMWLRRVHTRPADFLRAKFAHQQALESPGDNG